MAIGCQQRKTVEPGDFPQDAGDLILVVEDDPGLLALIEKSLNTNGFRTVGVRDGASALAALEGNIPRLMLLDYGLPDMRGEQLLDRIEALGRRMPFVVATGRGSESVAVEMMKRGAFDYLVKGATFMKLLPAVIDQALGRVRQAERLAIAEEELRQTHEELEQRVRQRTAELADANERLRREMEERRRAEDLVRQHQDELAHVARLSTVGEMVAELAHELNQPLSAISSYAQAGKRLLEGGVPEIEGELSAALNQVSEQANRAAEIIRRVRRFVAKAKPSQEPLDMNAVIRDVAELLRIDARTADVELVLDLCATLPAVAANRTQIEQVLVNLMRNAVESLRESEVVPRRLTICTSPHDGENVLVEVRDNGPGLAKESLDRVFDRFFTTKPEGMGMGLPIARSIVENHAGKMWASLPAERGAAFHFTLPIDIGEHCRGK